MRSQQWFDDEIQSITRNIDIVENDLNEVNHIISTLSQKEFNNTISPREEIKLQHLVEEKHQLQKKCTQLAEEKLLLLKQLDQFQASEIGGIGSGTASIDESFELTLPSSARDGESKTIFPSQPYQSRIGGSRGSDIGTNNPHWDYYETVSLIQEYGKLIDNFKRSHRNQSLWEHVSKELREKNVYRDWKQCKNRWKLIMDKFFEDSRYPGNNQDEEKHSCEFFVELDKLFREYGEYPAPSNQPRHEANTSAQPTREED
ncbi:hypothetical protein CONCODRAFT_70806 [Conidiobolus coronatus NRRL 28638]|uniref:Myb-like domain-containing protein n=1 Tax=Conidiobolus coronatus (strain ATCC 28846 / CBS 209.66 / NRRL 28638) TaxID=796925 RepID=A0A137P5R2_CONC2|nr:hypothetical protein CONCODRAFT_70806 [Conidiobolus coronatus NRRL 28638]|eukprot:KXN70274.1 hypothetical protein CONCODRAFT_70806 [Conidiobolus coronatus NRRL 28638]